ncbi:hypothetical protein B5E58_11920 [Tyzzerella sp. An114]|nr:hypothetical protein B5E58_11920 [Tyzzerella sp. An114]
MLSIYPATKKHLGVYKIYAVLKIEYGFNISLSRVYRLMKSMSLSKISTVKQKYYNYINTNSNQSDKNILNRNFSVNISNTVWISGITYIPIVIDLFSHKVISYVISTKIDSKLIINAFLSAFNKKDKLKILFFILITVLSKHLQLLNVYLII